MRPIQLLNAIRKLFSIIIHARVYHKLCPHVQDNNFGFLRGRGREMQLWNYAWMLASTNRYGSRFHVMGLDLKCAFDTVNRVKLLDALSTLEDFDDGKQNALDDDDLRMIRVLLATNEGKVRVGKCTGQSFPVDMGTPIGDCLSPLLFIFYLSRAILEVKEKWVEKTGVQDWTVRSYADDVDIFRRDDWSQDEQDQLKTLLHNTLEKWGMQLNEDKEESYFMSNKREEYLHIKKLGVMLDTNRHVSHTIQRAQQAFQRY